uniref:Uncharacterized protein n=1 Tax=Setaria italica TaxID=4555 RepID=K3XZQ5_SETIT
MHSLSPSNLSSAAISLSSSEEAAAALLLLVTREIRLADGFLDEDATAMVAADEMDSTAENTASEADAMAATDSASTPETSTSARVAEDPMSCGKYLAALCTEEARRARNTGGEYGADGCRSAPRSQGEKNVPGEVRRLVRGLCAGGLGYRIIYSVP